jgi:hypothetical protein
MKKAVDKSFLGLGRKQKSPAHSKVRFSISKKDRKIRIRP